MSAQKSWIGSSVERKEDERLLTGRGRYIDDLTPVAGLRHAAILRSPHPHARIRGIDTSEAEKLPGVIGVVTGAQIATVAGVIPSVVRSKVRYQVCATTKARYAGEPVAVVVADNRYVAEDALELIEVDYEPLPGVAWLEDAMKPGAPLLFEELESAQARGAQIYAEVLGYGTSNDAYHMAAPEPEAVGVGVMMKASLDRAGVEPERVGYINAHGTSTPLGDAAETKAIKDVFGDHAYRLAVSSTKSVMGHCFGAAGAIEAMMCVLAVREGVLPPTINYRNPDPACDLDYVPNEAREAEIDVALSNAMGLGGHNACVLVGRASD